MFVQELELSAFGNSTTLHVCTRNGTVCSTVTEDRYIFVQGIGTFCSTVTAQTYMFVQGMELSVVRKQQKVT